MGAAGQVFQHWDADVLEVFSPLCEALTLQTASPEYQLPLEQVLHQIQAVCVREKIQIGLFIKTTTKKLPLKF